MLNILHAFGAGIAFSVGILTGAILCQLATRQGRKEAIKDVKEHYEKVEARLERSAISHERMADYLESIQNRMP